MDFFEAKSDRGLERRVDEGDLRNLYRAGFLHLDSNVRRSGSPNWFRVEEMFPHFSQISSPKKYSANFKAHNPSTGLKTILIITAAILVVSFLLIRFSERIVAHGKKSTPAQTTLPTR